MSRKKLPEFLTVEEQEQLINVFNVRYWSSFRNKTMIRLFLATGLRLSEMINLKWQHINCMTGQFKVVEGKGSKDRMLYISEDTIDMLVQWREKQVEKVGKVDYVFTNNKGKQLVARDIREMVIKYSEKAGISKHVTPHVLRHSFATDTLKATNNLVLTQKLLGHSDISTTTIYTHLVDKDVENYMKTISK